MIFHLTYKECAALQVYHYGAKKNKKKTETIMQVR